MSTREDMDFLESDMEEKEVNLCPKANKVECLLNDSNDEVDFTNLNSTIEAYHELLLNSSRFSEAFQLPRKQNKNLLKENDILKNKLTSSNNDVKGLQQEVSNLEEKLNILKKK